MAGPIDFEVISFDCYGTLIDWESGILAVMHPVIEFHELVCTSEEVLAAYARGESAVEASGWLPYREVLRRTFASMAKDLGFAPRREELELLEQGLPRWQPFADTVAGLRALKAAGHRLAVISNVDDDLFAGTSSRLGVEFDLVVTAAQAKHYKPHPAMFERAIERLGLPADRILHAAQSRFHDVATAKRLGMQTVHVVRESGRAGGATPEVGDDEATRADWTVPDLAGLVALVGA
ncbi:haloacid dehalogenase type II [Nannocystaceae bacterium ST9]